MKTIPSFVSVGQAAALLQRSPAEITAAAEQLGIAPAERRNFVLYFRERDLGRIRRRLNRRRTTRRPAAR